MNGLTRRLTIGVMGSAGDVLPQGDKQRLGSAVEALASAIAKGGHALVTGATTGLPDLVARAVTASGGLTIGISPAENREEHVKQYGLPGQSSEVIIYSGFGLKGRNVINIRSSDIVLIINGGMGTLNEFTIAYDEGKVIGVLRGSGGVADALEGIIAVAGKPTRACVLFDENPEALLDSCVTAFRARQNL